jgi:hypothetical protein
MGDFNRDGHRDLAAADGTLDGVAILLGDGRGGFGPATLYASGRFSNTIAAADFDLDGKLDLAVPDESNEISVLRGDGNGAFSVGLRLVSGQSPAFPFIADFNNDGQPDIAVINWNTQQLTIYLNRSR